MSWPNRRLLLDRNVTGVNIIFLLGKKTVSFVQFNRNATIVNIIFLIYFYMTKLLEHWKEKFAKIVMEKESNAKQIMVLGL